MVSFSETTWTEVNTISVYVIKFVFKTYTYTFNKPSSQIRTLFVFFFLRGQRKTYEVCCRRVGSRVTTPKIDNISWWVLRKLGKIERSIVSLQRYSLWLFLDFFNSRPNGITQEDGKLRSMFPSPQVSFFFFHSSLFFLFDQSLSRFVFHLL